MGELANLFRALPRKERREELDRLLRELAIILEEEFSSGHENTGPTADLLTHDCRN
jgi:hypothetical protein